MQVTTVYGPPGTGKTRTLVEFAEGYVRDKKPVTFLSYTRAAAAEATSRLESDLVRVSTLHSLAYNALNVVKSSVVDKQKLLEFSKITGIPFKGQDEGMVEAQEGDEYMSVLSYARNQRSDSYAPVYDRFGRPGTYDRFRMFIKAYGEWKSEFGYWDFDDMLFHFANPKFRSPVKPNIVMLDEAQDCSPLQWMAFSKAVSSATEVYLAGDDDQAIYEWNGADPHGMASFTYMHRGANMILTKSHRVPKRVHDMSESLIRQLGTRIDKVYTPRDGDPGQVTRWGGIEDALFKLDEIAPDGALVLVRDRFKLEEIKRLLNQELIPYDVYGGMSPWTSKIARAIKRGDLRMDEVPIMWREFYAQADLSLPVKYHLSTVHSAKGREHETVIVDLGMPARVLLNITTDRDAELRVQYVSLTRSAKALHLCGENPLV